MKAMTRDLVDIADQWYVLLDGGPVAVLDNPKDAEMFWFTWDVHKIDGLSIPSNLWEHSVDSRRSFRHVETGELDPHAFPAGDGPLESGRIMIRGPIRGRDDEQKDAADRADP